MLLACGEHVDDTVNGVGGSEGMQRGEHELTGLGGCHSHVYGLIVAHLAQQYDVRGLAEHGAQRVEVAVGVDIDLALADDALLVAVQELYRVFDSDDMPAAVGIYVVDEAGESGGFTVARRAGDEHDAVLAVGELHYRVGDAEVGGFGELEGHETQHRGVGSALAVDVGSESSHACHREGEIQFPADILPVRQVDVCHVVDLEHEIPRHIRLEDLPLLLDEFSGHLVTQHGAGDDEHVGRVH